MNEKLQEAVATLIQKSLAAFEAGADFLAAEIPDVVHQLLMWHAVKSAVFFVLGIVLVIVWLVVDYKLFKLARAEAAKYTPPYNEATVFFWGILGCIPRVIVFLFCAHLITLTWLQIWIAPKVWLIEYAANLAK